MNHGKGRVLLNQQVAADMRLMWLEAPPIAASAAPGQFVMVRCSDGYDPLLRRPFSVHRLGGFPGARYGSGALALLFRVIGHGTAWLGRQAEGEDVDLLGPLGRGFSLAPDVHNLLLVAGGIGVAPLVALADEAIRRDRAVTVLLGAKESAGLLPSQLFPPEVELVSVTEDGSAGRRGLVTDLLPEYLGWADEVFACGPLSMYHTMAGVEKRLGSRKPAQVCLEEHMGCGIGVCLGCVVETRRGIKRACRDGPVFYLADLKL